MDALTIIEQIIADYFRGLHIGDVDLLTPLFDVDCVLKSPTQRRTLASWLADVSQRPKPKDIEHPWRYHVIHIDIEGQQAMAKVSCPLPHGNFIDYLGLLKEGDRWRIVNKMYAVNEEQ